MLLAPVKRKRPRNNSRNGRAFSKQYFITKHSSKEKVPVCLAAFCGILKIKQGRVKGVSNRYAATGETAFEKRGGDRKYHAFRSKREAVQNFIKKFRPLDSHYCRGKVNPFLTDGTFMNSHIFRLCHRERKQAALIKHCRSFLGTLR